MDAQLKKGVLELCLLHGVSEDARYGYDLLQTLRGHFPEVSESACYGILRRLHREGLVEQFTGETSGGPPRKYYRVTEAGREALACRTADWQMLVRILQDLGIS